jgi:hypothetical protein
MLRLLHPLQQNCCKSANKATGGAGEMIDLLLAATTSSGSIDQA